MPVRVLLASIDSRELTEWMAFYRMEPWGTEADDWRAGMIASTIANANRDPKRKTKPYHPADFMPKREQRQVPEQTPEQQKLIIEMLAAQFAARQK